MADDIEVHYDANNRELMLSCGSQAFARVRNAVIAASDVGELAIEGVPDDVVTIVIEQPHEPPIKSHTRLRDRMALLGCGLVAFGIMSVLAIGVATIVRWML